jgi:hypothetical protein
MALWAKIWAGIKWVLSLIHPALGWAGGWRKHSSTLLWIVHFIVLALVLTGLAFLNNRFPLLHSYIKSESALLREWLWLPLVGLSIYALIWMGWWLWLLLSAGEEGSHFPDIDEAWNEAVRAVQQAGIDLTDVPLFLVFGRSGENEESLFQAANLQLAVTRAPKRHDAPVHVYANRDGIYVTCPGASLMGRQAAVLGGEVAVGGPATNGEEAAAEFDPGKTMTPQGPAEEVRMLLVQAKQEKRELSDEENEKIRQLVAQDEAEAAQLQGRARSVLLKDGAERDRLTARLRHLCRLIVRDRSPFCPLNGILLVIPVAATDSEEDANQTGRLCHYDLRAVRQVMQTRCPVFTLVGDLESLPGNCFREFVERFPEADRGRRVGQRFPLMADLEPAALEPKIVEAGAWVCNALVPSWVYKRFRVDRPGRDTYENAVQGNCRLFQFMYHMWERQQRLGRILARSVMPDDESPPLFGGCYLGGTGRDRREQAFVAGVFQRLVLDQSAVSWTDEAMAEDATYRRGTVFQIIALIAVIAVVAGLIIWRFVNF